MTPMIVRDDRNISRITGRSKSLVATGMFAKSMKQMNYRGARFRFGKPGKDANPLAVSRMQFMNGHTGYFFLNEIIPSQPSNTSLMSSRVE